MKPIGVFDATAEKAVYRPIVLGELLFLVPLMAAGLAVLMASSWDKRGRMHMDSRCKTKRQGMKLKNRGHGCKEKMIFRELIKAPWNRISQVAF